MTPYPEIVETERNGMSNMQRLGLIQRTMTELLRCGVCCGSGCDCGCVLDCARHRPKVDDHA